jgi:hypothetical protein
MKFLEVTICTVISTDQSARPMNSELCPGSLDFDHTPRCLIIVAFRAQKIIVVLIFAHVFYPKPS